MLPRALLLCVWAVCVGALVSAVRPGDFKGCQDSSVCRRFRHMAEHVDKVADAGYESPYALRPEVQKPHIDGNVVTLPVRSALYPNVSFEMRISLFADGNARVQMDEVSATYGGWKHYDQASMWAVKQMPPAAKSPIPFVLADEGGKGPSRIFWGNEEAGTRRELILEHEPLKLHFVRDGVVQMILNERGLLHMEHYRAKSAPREEAKDEYGTVDTEKQAALTFQDRKKELRLAHRGAGLRRRSPATKLMDQWAGLEREDGGAWEESWNGIPDNKPKGPEGVALDVSFPGYGTLYGLPEHASPLSLRSTRAPPHGEEEEEGRYSDPYRLMNTDVFEYNYDSPMSLYGSAPILHAQSRGSSVAVLWMNAAETWIDLHKTRRRPGPRLPHTGVGAPTSTSQEDKSAWSGGSSKLSSHAHFFSESGVLDMFVFLGPTATRNMERYTSLVGRTALPQYFALAYHQCRWNYFSDTDVKDVTTRFDRADIPMDVMWLDIEYAKDHMYGVWDRSFADPEGMLRWLDALGRKLVIIMDPHLKTTRDYWLYREAKDQRLLVRGREREQDYEGNCWSGHASWIDFFNPRTWLWWIEQHSLAARKLRANARNLFIWNDMSEPAIFDGPEVTSPKDVWHYGWWENRDIHNINAVIMHNLTATGLTRRELGTTDAAGRPGVERRPFVLSRGWWLGTQQYGAVWTGDNMGTWEHFAGTVPMLLANGMGGMSFCGADIGGFFGNPTNELLLRWYQAGIFEPFFRAHAHSDTKRREPFLFEVEMRASARRLLQLRYQMLPVWYTAFWHSGVSGQPVLRPQHLLFPHDEAGFTIDDQYYLGDSGLLVKPAVHEGERSVEVYLAEPQRYYHYFTRHVYDGAKLGHRVRVPAPLTHELPLLIRGGSIVPVRERNRRAAELQRLDPFTLRIALSNHGPLRAQGMLYLDDGQTFAYRDASAFIARRFTLRDEGAGQVLTASALTAHQADIPKGTDVALQKPNPYADEVRHVRVERIVVLGLKAPPQRVAVRDARGERDVEFSWTPASGMQPTELDGSTEVASELVVRDPAVPIGEDWTVVFA